MDSKYLYDFLIKVQSIARIGLKYSRDPYALSNYQEINDLTVQFLNEFMEINLNRPNYFERNIYPTPSTSVRTIILNKERTKVLMVREAESKTYSLPGGWEDLYDSPSQTAVTECRQEAGAKIEVVRLVGVTSRTPFKNPVSVPENVIIFEGKIVGELGEHEYETDDVNFFPIDKLPPISRKTSAEELSRFILAAVNGETIFD